MTQAMGTTQNSGFLTNLERHNKLETALKSKFGHLESFMWLQELVPYRLCA